MVLLTLGGKGQQVEADEPFKSLFRLDSTSSSCPATFTLDRLSRLACDRQGISPLELLRVTRRGDSRSGERPHAAISSGTADADSTGRGDASNISVSPRSPSSAACSPRVSRSVKRAVELARQEAEATRRLSNVKIVEKERQYLLREVHEAAHTDHLNHDQVKLRAQLLQQEEAPTSIASEGFGAGPSVHSVAVPPSAAGIAATLKWAPPQCHDPSEAELVRRVVSNDAHERALEQQRAMLKQSVEKFASHGHEEIEHMRRRQMTLIVNELRREVEREDLLSYMQQRDDELAAVNEQKLAEATKKAKKEARRARQKVVALKIRQYLVDEKKREVLHERMRARDKQLQEIEAEKERQIKEREEIGNEKLEQAKQRAEAARQLEAEQREALRVTLEAQETEHLERHRLLRARLLLGIETKRHQSTERQRLAETHVGEGGEGHPATTASARIAETDRRLASAEWRRKEHEAAMTRRLEEQRERREIVQEQVIERRVAVVEEKQKKNLITLVEEEHKQVHVAEVKQETRLQATIKAALFDLKLSQHRDNVERLVRLDDYRHKLKQAMLDEALSHDREQRRMRRESQRRLQESKRLIAQERDHIITNIAKISRQHSPRKLLDELTRPSAVPLSPQRLAALSNPDASVTAPREKSPSAAPAEGIREGGGDAPRVEALSPAARPRAAQVDDVFLRGASPPRPSTVGSSSGRPPMSRTNVHSAGTAPRGPKKQPAAATTTAAGAPYLQRLPPRPPTSQRASRTV